MQLGGSHGCQAIYNLGACYEEGFGVPEDLGKAVELYRKAAHLGNYYVGFTDPLKLTFLKFRPKMH